MTETVNSPRREMLSQLSLALPILGGQLAQTGNGVVDTMMAGRVSEHDLAAVAMGASFWVPFYLFMTGVLMSATPLISRHLGRGSWERVNPLAQQSLWLALLLGCVGAVLLRQLEPVVVAMDVEPALRPLVQGYLEGLSWGIPGAALFLSMRSYTEAMAHTRPVLIISILGLLINIPINYILIYGKFGMPAMGGVGCGWASGITFWLMALMMFGYIRLHRAYARARLSLRQPQLSPALLGRMLKLGLPIGLAIFFESSIFAVIALLIGHLGAVVVAGHQVALNVSSLLFIVPLSLGIAVTVRVSHARGRGDGSGINLAVRTGYLLAIGSGCLTASLLLLTRGLIPPLYTDNPEVRQLATGLLLFAGLYQISDALQIIAAGALRGFEDTARPMLYTLFSYWGIGLPTGIVLAQTDWLGTPMGPAGFWIGLLVGLTCSAVLLGIRLHRRRQQELVLLATGNA
ncbi:MATE family efflux transporter [Isoalcanivorax beigongshangi]|uniref:Multidrug-efflux transporter n=1 Tax=Isoalcanivorax beigongshangi TaxID=3238810 RepID=A0ABV4AHB8_9GAMM